MMMNLLILKMNFKNYIIETYKIVKRSNYGNKRNNRKFKI